MAMESIMDKKELYDPFGRRIRKLRVSLLDACNFRCFYCMPKNATFTKTPELLTAKEIQNICRVLLSLGLEQIRVTGGEPTIRKDFVEIMERLASLPIAKLGLTSNGFKLSQYLEKLYGLGCRHLNISMDSLQEDKFNTITYSKGYQKVYNSILKAKELGFNVKVNAVLLRGINDDEFGDFINFSAKFGVEVRFLELMKIGQGCMYQDTNFLSAAAAIQSIKTNVELFPKSVDFDSTSFNFTTAGGASIGFIASETQPFCESCSRLRLTSTGVLRACLMSEKGLNLKGVPEEEYEPILRDVMAMKPPGRIEHIKQNMYQIGG